MTLHLMPRHRRMLTALCAPYATLLMIRQQHNYRFGILQVRGKDVEPRVILNYDTLVKWVEIGLLERMLHPQERYEISVRGRTVVAEQEPTEKPAPRWLWLQYGEQARKALKR